jgi:hypothetical protein
MRCDDSLSNRKTIQFRLDFRRSVEVFFIKYIHTRPELSAWMLDAPAFGVGMEIKILNPDLNFF